MKSAEQLWARIKVAAQELAVSSPALTYTQAENLVLEFNRAAQGEQLPEDARVHLTIQLLNLVARHRSGLRPTRAEAAP
jgi:hypothetical protein